MNVRPYVKNWGMTTVIQNLGEMLFAIMKTTVTIIVTAQPFNTTVKCYSSPSPSLLHCNMIIAIVKTT